MFDININLFSTRRGRSKASVIKESSSSVISSRRLMDFRVTCLKSVSIGAGIRRNSSCILQEEGKLQPHARLLSGPSVANERTVAEKQRPQPKRFAVSEISGEWRRPRLSRCVANAIWLPVQLLQRIRLL
jgi:hypothetical protein